MPLCPRNTRHSRRSLSPFLKRTWRETAHSSHYTLTYAVSGDPRSPGLPRIGAHPPWLVAGGLPEHGDVRHLTVGATVPAQYATQSPLALSLFKTNLERNGALFALYPYLPRLSRPPISGTAPYRCPPSMASCRGSP